jgi:hypothetical protein
VTVGRDNAPTWRRWRTIEIGGTGAVAGAGTEEGTVEGTVEEAGICKGVRIVVEEPETLSNGTNKLAGQAVVAGTALEDVAARTTRASPREAMRTRNKIGDDQAVT